MEERASCGVLVPCCNAPVIGLGSAGLDLPYP